jgi:hypothetical protein
MLPQKKKWPRVLTGVRGGFRTAHATEAAMQIESPFLGKFSTQLGGGMPLDL